MTRRGSHAIYLDIDHSDIEEFLSIKDVGNPIQSLFYGVSVPDYWMEEMIGGDKEKRNIWAKVLESRKNKGLPYIFFKDNVNKGKPQVYKDLNEEVVQSNLCATGDTIIAVADGYNGKTIKELAEYSQGKLKFPVYSAKPMKSQKRGRRGGGTTENPAWRPEIKYAVAFKTGTKKVLKITLSDGSTMRFTPDHRFARLDGGYVEAQYSKGVELMPFYTYTPQVDQSPYRHINTISNGSAKQHLLMWKFFKGDSKGHIDHIEDDLEYRDVLSNLQTLTREDSRAKTAKGMLGKENAVYKIRDKERWRINNYNSHKRSAWWKFCDCLDSCREIYKSEGYFDFKLYNQKLIEGYPKLYSLNVVGFKYGNFDLLKEYVIDIPTSYPPEPEYTELPPREKTSDHERLEYLESTFSRYEGDCKSLRGLTVVSIEEDGVEDVYDLTVEDNHNFFIITKTDDDKYLNCSGVLVHNCTEIALPSHENESFVCCLASLNLAKYDEWKDTDVVSRVVYFLDAVMQDFIDKTENIKHMEDVRRFAMRHRALGVGT